MCIRDRVEEARQLSKTLGFVSFDTVDHARNYGPALDKEGNVPHWILPAGSGKWPKPYDVPAGIERYKQTHANFFPEEKVYNINCEHEQDESVYIDAQGRIGPCCYQGFDLPELPFVHLKDFPKLKESWVTNKCDSMCVQACGLK